MPEKKGIGKWLGTADATLEWLLSLHCLPSTEQPRFDQLDPRLPVERDAKIAFEGKAKRFPLSTRFGQFRPAYSPEGVYNGTRRKLVKLISGSLVIPADLWRRLDA